MAMQWIEALINVGALAGFIAVATCEGSGYRLTENNLIRIKT
jgi:hypothetical protein